MQVQRARLEVKRCPMSETHCADRIMMQAQKFYPTGEHAVDVRPIIEKACGRYTKGKHAGQLRGWANLLVCTEGGWKTYGPGEGNGRVIYPGTVLGLSITGFTGDMYYATGERF